MSEKNERLHYNRKKLVVQLQNPHKIFISNNLPRQLRTKDDKSGQQRTRPLRLGSR